MNVPPEAISVDVALVGAGRVGTAVAALLQRAGYNIVGVASRSPASCERARSYLDAPGFAWGTPLPDAHVVLIGVPDEVIVEVARVTAPTIAPGTAVCHFAGSLGVKPLDPVVAVGGVGLALHPVQPCPDIDTAIAHLPGSAWGVTASPGGEPLAEHLVGCVEGVPFVLDEEDRVLWHAAAVTTSNGIAALAATGEAMLRRIGISDPQRVLGPLAAGGVANARRAGAAATLTGPVVRGEHRTIERHVQALQERAPELLDAYASCVRSIAQAAAAVGRIDAATADRMRAASGSP